MSFRWLKPYLPRGLYGRATLILLLPVVTLLLVVSVVFIQRHFEGVTQQMTGTMMREIRLVLESDDPAVAETLNIRMQPVPEAAMPDSDTRLWYDFSGIVVARELQAVFPDLVRVALADDDIVELYFRRGTGLVREVFDRRHVSARQPPQLLVSVVVFVALFMSSPGEAVPLYRDTVRPVVHYRVKGSARFFSRVGLPGLGQPS